MKDTSATLGKMLRTLRRREGWTLNEMADRSGIPVSTLSKIEHDRLSLTYDKLVQLSQRLGISMSDFFAQTAASRPPAVQPITARRSIDEVEHALRVQTPNYDYYYLNTDLRRKRMIPVVTRIRAKTTEEFGELLRHPGEEFIYVMEGALEMHTEHYDPIILHAGTSIYIDSDMGHAYLAADGFDEAVVLGVMTSAEDDPMSSLLSLHTDAGDGSSTLTRPKAVRGRPKKKDGGQT